MQRRNGMSYQMRTLLPQEGHQFQGRQTCFKCNRLVPRGSDRPFCLDHAAYPQKLMRELASKEPGKAEGNKPGKQGVAA